MCSGCLPHGWPMERSLFAGLTTSPLRLVSAVSNKLGDLKQRSVEQAVGSTTATYIRTRLEPCTIATPTALIAACPSRPLPLPCLTEPAMRCRFVALGAGHARRETAPIENLIRPGFTDVHGESSIEVFLIDTSLCLLSDGYNYAVSHLSREGIPVTAVEGDFMRLQTFSDRFAPRAPRRKLFTLLGFTLVTSTTS